MDGIDAKTGDPLSVAFHGDDHSVCPDCGHARQKPRWSLRGWLVSHAGFKPARPFCTYYEDSIESGVGLPGDCGCRNVFHAS